MGFTGPHDQDTPLQAAAREVGWMLSEMVDGAPWERRGQIQDALGRLAVTIDASPQPEAGEAVALADLIETRLLGVRPDDQDLALEDHDWRLILQSLRTAPPSVQPVEGK